MNGNIDRQLTSKGGVADRETVLLTPQYVDCECDESYIKAVPEGGYAEGDFACAACGPLIAEQPDSRVNEVEAAGLPYDRERIEFAGFA